MVLLRDASFANAEGIKSQLLYVILFAGDLGACNIGHHGSNKCKRLARSAMSAKVQALILGFYFAFLIRNLAQEIMGKTRCFETMIYSNTVLNIVAKDAQKCKRRLQILVLALRHNYDERNLSHISWIPGCNHPAYYLTKTVLSERMALSCIMSTKIFLLLPQGW